MVMKVMMRLRKSTSPAGEPFDSTVSAQCAKSSRRKFSGREARACRNQSGRPLARSQTIALPWPTGMTSASQETGCLTPPFYLRLRPEL